MKTEEMLILGTAGLAAVYFLGKTNIAREIGSNVGDAIGQTVTSIPTGIVEGSAKTIKTFISDANEAGKDNPFHLSNLSWSIWKAGQTVKRWGNNNRWFS